MKKYFRFASGDSHLHGNDSLIIRAVLRSNRVGTKNCSILETSFPRKRESPDAKRNLFKLFLDRIQAK